MRSKLRASVWPLAFTLTLGACGGGGGGSSGGGGDQQGFDVPNMPPSQPPADPPSEPPRTLTHLLSIEGEGDIATVADNEQLACTVEQEDCTTVATMIYQVTYAAIPRSGWIFSGWADCSPTGVVNDNHCQYSLSADEINQFPGMALPELTANFFKPRFTHALSIIGQGDILADDSERRCRQPDTECQNQVTDEYRETYRARSADGWRFVGWRNCEPLGSESGDECRYRLSFEELLSLPDASVTTLVAEFEEIPLDRTFLDTFDTNSVNDYELDTADGDSAGSVEWDSDNKALELNAGSGASIRISRAVRASDTGLVSFDLLPTRSYSGNGTIIIALTQDEQNYYEIINSSDGTRSIRKIVAGSVVASTSLDNNINNDSRYTVDIGYSPSRITVSGFRRSNSLTGDDSALSVKTISLQVRQLDAYIDTLYSTDEQSWYLLALGDSATNGVGDENLENGKGYTPILKDLLLSNNDVVATVVNEGEPGATARDYTDDINGILRKHPKASAVLLHLGINDSRRPAVPSGAGLRSGDGGYAGSFKASMQELIDAARGRQLQVYIARTLRTTSDDTWDNDAQADYGSAVDELVSENGLNTISPDFYCYFAATPEQLPDARHPNDAGYRATASLWRKSLRNRAGENCSP